MHKIVGDHRPDWEDMSRYVVHFSSASGWGETSRKPYDNVVSILFSGRIEARRRYGAGKNSPHSPMSVCLSEIPLHLIQRLAEHHGNYGIGFRKETIVQKGGGPILYAYKGTSHATAISEAVEVAAGDPTHPIWKIAPFVDITGVHGSKPYFFEWEREWRLCGNLNFAVTEPAFLIIPDEEHQVARAFFDDHGRNNTGPNYSCPFIAPTWDRAKVTSVIRW